MREGVGEGGLLVRHPEQVLVRDDEQRIDDLLQFGDAGFGDAHAPLAFEVERLGDDADGQDAGFLRAARDHRRRAGAGAAAHAGGDEHHVRALQVVADLVDHLLGGGAADLGLRAGAEAFGDVHAHLDDALGLRHASAPARRCWRRRTRRPADRLVIMLLTALPPAPPTPNTVIRGFSSRMSGIFRLMRHVCLFMTRKSCTPGRAGPPPAVADVVIGSSEALAQPSSDPAI